MDIVFQGITRRHSERSERIQFCRACPRMVLSGIGGKRSEPQRFAKCRASQVYPNLRAESSGF